MGSEPTVPSAAPADTRAQPAGSPDGLAAAGADPAESSTTEDASAAGSQTTEAEVVREDLLFQSTLGAIYHRDREAMCDAFYRGGLAATIFLSTGAVATLAASMGGAIWISVLVAIVSTANLAFDFAGAARRHRDLRRPYHDLAAELATASDDQLPALRAKMIRIAADAPAVLCGAHALAFNAATRALGRDESYNFDLTPWQKLVAHVLPMTNVEFRRRIERRDDGPATEAISFLDRLAKWKPW